MSQRRLGTATLALGLVVLIDVLRVFLPSVITIFGQAASTPAELLGAYALGWFVLALAAPVLVARVGADLVGVVAVLLLGAARLALTAAPGGRAQLWLASAGLLAGLVWLAATAARVAHPVPGLVLGLTANALGHALLGTYDLVWWGRWPAWVASVAVVAALLAAETAFGRRRDTTQRVDDDAPPARLGWLLVGPALLLGGMVALSPAVAITAMSYWYGEAGTGLSPPFALAPWVSRCPCSCSVRCSRSTGGGGCCRRCCCWSAPCCSGTARRRCSAWPCCSARQGWAAASAWPLSPRRGRPGPARRSRRWPGCSASPSRRWSTTPPTIWATPTSGYRPWWRR
ncbi:hypothetical protein GCM10029963_31050 [Micromonospora andamanensis]